MNNNRNIGVIGSCFLNTSATVSVVNPGGTEVSQVCPSAINNTTCNSGSLPGLLRFTYTGTITVPSTACNVTFRYALANRNTTVNVTNSIGEQFYIETILNLSTSSTNSSPQFAFDPIAYAIQGQPITFNFGATDPDGDSLKYSLVGAKGYNGSIAFGNSSLLGYEPGYSATSPIQGITLNQNTGAASALPTVQGNFIVVCKVEEFDNGVLIGEMIRDIQIVVVSDPNNIPTAPSTFTNFSGWADSVDQSTISAYPGMDFCIDITFSDNDASDSLSLVTNLSSVLPGASLSLTGTNPLTANVCWTATAGMPVSNTVVFNVSDSACPVSGVNSYSLNVLVPPCNGLVGRVRTQDASCAGSCDGWAKVKMFCGSGNYTYNWVNTNVGPIPPDDSVTLCASSTQYNLVVTDNVTSEVYSRAVSIQEPPSISISSSTNAASCGGACDGTISTIVTGGTPPFNYSWSDVSSNTPNRSGLCAGTYGLTVTDQKGCSQFESYTIVSPPSIDASVVSVSDPLCAGGSSGEVAIESIVGCGNVPSSTCSSLDTAQVGTGNIALAGDNYPAIYGATRQAGKHQMIYTASELQAQGVEPGPIEEIGFDVATVSPFAASYSSFEIKMSCTSASDLSGGFETGLGTVYNPQFG
ncbi:MAG: SprB repeat-containing protein, partial [Salibacter sp.]